MNILHLAAEVAPYVTVGGLSQVMYFLPRSLKKQGHDVRIFTPKYGSMKIGTEQDKAVTLSKETMGLKVPVDHDRGDLVCNVLTYKPKNKKDAQVYFLENREYYELRANVFGYKDDPTRFALLSKACLEWLRAQDERRQAGEKVWWPDVIHCHDWHTAFFIDLARREDAYGYHKLLKKTPVVLTVHNFKYQGGRDFRYLPDEEKDKGIDPVAPLTSDRLARQNALMRGIKFADAITTVSPTHAVEVLTPEYAYGLEEVLTEARGKLSGILNGLDMKEFNPATDPLIKKHYNATTFSRARAVNKQHLQKEFRLPQDPDAPLMGYVGRLASQKGWDLLLDVLPNLLEERTDAQLIVVGGGDEKYRKGLADLEERFPKRVATYLFPNFRLPRKVFSAVDMMLMPSMFEPGGIVALEALRYGAVPIVRETGGLSDIVGHYDPDEKSGNGFLFTHQNPWALYGVIIEAMTIYRQKRLWQKLVKNGLEEDFSWSHAAKEYEDWYERVTRERGRILRRRFRIGVQS